MILDISVKRTCPGDHQKIGGADYCVVDNMENKK